MLLPGNAEGGVLVKKGVFIDMTHVMLFAMTLGTYSIIPTIYLWREVSKRLAVVLLVFFLAVGWIVGMIF